jgi:hypothetical protein
VSDSWSIGFVVSFWFGEGEGEGEVVGVVDGRGSMQAGRIGRY